MKYFRHVAFKPTEIRYKEQKPVLNPTSGLVEIVEIEKSKPSESLEFHWVSEDEDPSKSNPYPDRKDVSFRVEDPNERDVRTFLSSKATVALRERRRIAKEAIETLKASPTWTVAQTRQAVLRILDLLEV